MKTPEELLDRLDRATASLRCYEMTNHLAYLKWPAKDRMEFDVGKEQAQREWSAAYAEYHAAISARASQ